MEVVEGFEQVTASVQHFIGEDILLAIDPQVGKAWSKCGVYLLVLNPVSQSDNTIYPICIILCRL